MNKKPDWNENAIAFINYSLSFNPKNSNTDIVSANVLKVKELAGADIVLLLNAQDEFFAKVSYAHPSYLDDVTIKGDVYQRTVLELGESISYISDLSRAQHGFPELFIAMDSGVIVPISHKSESRLMILGWSERQMFEPSFKSFLVMVMERMKEIFRNTYYRKITDENIDLMANVFHKLPQGVIYIDDDGYTGWVNYAGAALLQLPLAGKQVASFIGNSMQNLRKQTSNKADIEARAAEIFKSRYLSIDQWLWHFDETVSGYATLCVSTRAVKSAHTSGRLWIFEDISNICTKEQV